MPTISAVGGLEQSAAGAVNFVVVLPRALACLPHRGVHYVGIGRINFHIGGTGVFIFVNNFLPGLAAIGRTEQASLLIGAVGMTENCGKDSIGIARIDG